MSLVTQTLLNLIAEQIKAHGTVVWYDPEKTYAGFAASLTSDSAAGAAVHRYQPERGFVSLRRELEPTWGRGTTPPRLLIYVPLTPAAAHHALVEYEVGGVVMAPSQHPPERNTSLAAVAQRALAAVRPAAALEQIISEVEAGKWTLAELDREAERGLEAQVGVLKLVFDTGNAAAIALRFLSDPGIDERIMEKGALATLATVLEELLGIAFRADEGTARLREHLARQILVTDFLAAFGDAFPSTALPALAAFPLAERPVARRAAVDLATTWRNRRDAVASYVCWANQIETEIGASSLGGTGEAVLEALARSETFVGAEVRLQKEVELALVARPSRELVDLADCRLVGFWAGQRPEVKARWDVIADAGRVIVEAGRIVNALKGKKPSALDLVLAYTQGDAKRTKKKSAATSAGCTDSALSDLWDADGPWCILDTAQRHLERDFHRFELDIREHFSLLGLVAHARTRYAAVAESLAEKFLDAYEAEKYDVARSLSSGSAVASDTTVLNQTDVFARVVEPVADTGRVAYLLVDAFRYEMARELRTLLTADYAAELIPALAAPPTVTEIGMAALLPGAERGLAAVPAANGDLAAVVGGVTLAVRQDRLDYFAIALKSKTPSVSAQTTSGVPIAKANGGHGMTLATARLDQLSPLTDPHLRSELKAAHVIVVTATEDIDRLCENTPNLARTMLDEALMRLRRSVKTLFRLGVTAIVISADHGYLFGEKLTSGEGIDPPGGKTVALKRRVWVGQGGAKVEGTLRAPLSAFGVGGALELVTPRGLSAFKVPGGATEYFHGGLSLQELVIPVLTVHSNASQGEVAGAQVKWKLTLGSAKITTRFVSVTVEGGGEGLLPIQPPIVRVEVRAGGATISVPVSASYGFAEATGDVKLGRASDSDQQIAAVTVTLMITQTPAVARVAVYLLDASTGVTLSSVDKVPFAISM